MAVSFKIPSSPPKTSHTISEFLGADLTNSAANVDPRRSPDCQNMVRDVPGKVRKRMGWHTIAEYDGPINGYHYLRGDSEYLIHAGTKLYRGTTEIYSGMNNAKSHSWQFGDLLYIIDGKEMLVYYREGNTNHVATASSLAYIPTVTISKDPSGGGTSYEDLNLIQPGFTETFLGQAGVTQYSLSFADLDNTPVTVKIMNNDGTWTDKTEGTDFTVNRTTGVITFTTAPGASPVTGEDNVSITAYRTVDGYADRINKCTFGTLYGANGGNDRLFLSGNPDYRNYDWHSQQYDPTYFADTSYARLGTDASAIMGYSIISNYLATHKDDMERDQNIILRSGSITDDATIFRVVNTLQGAGALTSECFAYIATEPLFLTVQGIFAVTAQDISGEKYAQNRSYYLNGKLLKEENLANAVACAYNDMYVLAVNNRLYILDGLQATQTDKSAPYATRQYVGYFCTSVPAYTMWTHDSELWFGTQDGKLCKFYTDPHALESYSDDGVPIECWWETADFNGKIFYKNKSLRYVAIRLKSAVATSIRIYAMDRGLWTLIKSDETGARYFSFSNFMFSKFTFSTNTSQQMIHTKARIKKVDSFRLRLVNDALNEPFGLYDLAVEFVENGYYKG